MVANIECEILRRLPTTFSPAIPIIVLSKCGADECIEQHTCEKRVRFIIGLSSLLDILGFHITSILPFSITPCPMINTLFYAVTVCAYERRFVSLSTSTIVIGVPFTMECAISFGTSGD